MLYSGPAHPGRLLHDAGQEPAQRGRSVRDAGCLGARLDDARLPARTRPVVPVDRLRTVLRLDTGLRLRARESLRYQGVKQVRGRREPQGGQTRITGSDDGTYLVEAGTVLYGTGAKCTTHFASSTWISA